MKFPKLFLILALLVGFFAQAQTALEGERIEGFDVLVKINQDSSINVVETIVYNFGYNARHGIYRDIPYKYRTDQGRFNLRISEISVSDQNGNPYSFEISNSGNNKRIKIGDPSTLINGIKTYDISYKVERAMNFFPDHDELYWNVTGSNWQVPIDQAVAKVVFPRSLPAKTLRTACFAGSTGSSQSCTLIDGTVFRQDHLGPYQGLTIVVGLPPGTVTKPSVTKNIWEAVRDNLILLLPVLLIIFLFYKWWIGGREPKGRGVVVAQYEAPDNLSPSQVGTIMDLKIDNQDLTADLVNLAVRGNLTITYLPKQGIFGSDDYRLDKLKDGSDLKNKFEKRLLDSLFKGGDIVNISDLKYKFYKDAAVIRKDIFDDLVSRGYIKQNPDSLRATYFTIGGAMIFLGFWLGGWLGVLGIISLIISGVITLIFGSIMPAKTVKGSETRELILGLKEYLSVAEADRIKFHNPPKQTPEHFEKLLPYAIALGVETQWAKQFERIHDIQPSWYVGTGMPFNAIYLASSLGNFSAVAGRSMTVAARGGSGFGGGGVGGGGGGGGGGSW